MHADGEREQRGHRAGHAVGFARSPRATSGAYTGMNDADSAPSPNRFCRKLGMRNAALNASASTPRPK